MRELSRELALITRDDGPACLAEAKRIIRTLHEMNRRWNIQRLNEFLLARQKELFF